MPVVAHSEKELIVDVFGEGCKRFECDYYCVESNRMAWTRRNQVRYYDLGEDRMIRELEIDEPREVKVAPSGRYVGILTSKGELTVFDEDGVKLERKDVFRFRISDCLVAYVSQDVFCAHRIKDGEIGAVPFHRSKIPVLEFFVSGDVVLLATKKLAKDGQHKILKISGDSVESLQSLETLQGFSMKTHLSGKYMLFLLMTSYVNNSYFPESSLYLYDVEKHDFRKLDVPTVHYYVFISNGFAVCHGAQPSDVSVYDLDGGFKFRFPKGARNRIFFNQHENIVVFSGFDNLSGDIEVFDVGSRRLISKFNVLGASLVNWRENGSYFYVSTTSYFQEDNRITVYDYYGRVCGERTFKSLDSVSTYGDKEDFVRLEPPVDPIIEAQPRYVPPSLRSGAGVVGKKRPSMERRGLGVARPRESTRDEIEGMLEKIRELKGRMQGGEELSVGELNLILREAKLSSDLRRFEE